MSEDKNFIRLVDEDGFESKINLVDNSDLLYLLRNLKVGTKVQIRLAGWFGLDAIVVPFDVVVPD